MTERIPVSSLSASSLASELDEQELAELIRPLPKAKARKLQHQWGFWPRHRGQSRQMDWRIWLLLAGRGFGKTRTGAEWVRANMCGDTPLTGRRWRHVALIAETAADARDVMVGDGKMLSDPNAGSGILQVHPADSSLARCRPTTRRLSIAAKLALSALCPLGPAPDSPSR